MSVLYSWHLKFQQRYKNVGFARVLIVNFARVVQRVATNAHASAHVATLIVSELERNENFQ